VHEEEEELVVWHSVRRGRYEAGRRGRGCRRMMWRHDGRTVLLRLMLVMRLLVVLMVEGHGRRALAHPYQLPRMQMGRRRQVMLRLMMG